MKKVVSETIDGSIKDIIQLKTLDNSLEYSQMFDALEDTPREFQIKLVDALNSLGETMQVPPTEAFNKVLCKSDDENEDVTKKLYNWWRAFFEVLGKCENIPNDRKTEFNQKIDDLMAEIMKAGDAEATDEEEPVMESSDDEYGYQQATKEDEDKMLADMDFAIQHIGEVANKVKAVVNFINPYCGTEVNESGEGFSDEDILAFLNRYTQLYGWGIQDVKSALRGEISPGFKCAILDALPVKGHPAYNELVKRMGPIMCQIVDKNQIYRESNRITEEEKHARYRVGDKVKVVGRGLASKGWIGVVSSVDRSSPGLPYTVDFDGRESGEYAPEELSPAKRFTEEENSKMKKKMNEHDMNGGPWLPENEIIGMKVTGEAGGDNLDAEEFIDMMTNGAGATPLFDPYNGEQEKDGTVVLNVIAHREQVSYKDVQDGFAEQAAEYGWEFKSFGYSDDLTSGMVDDGNVEIDVVFAPMQQVSENLENELKKGDDGWTTIGQPVGESSGEPLDATKFIEAMMEDDDSFGGEISFVDGEQDSRGEVKILFTTHDRQFRRGPDKKIMDMVDAEARKFGWALANFGWKDNHEDFTANFYVPMSVNEAKVVVDANDVWDVLELLDNDIANKELTDLINSHVRTEEEIMDAINELSGPEISKKELNTLLSGRMATLVDYLGLDVEQYEDMGNFVDSDKPVTLESEGGILKRERMTKGYEDAVEQITSGKLVTFTSSTGHEYKITPYGSEGKFPWRLEEIGEDGKVKGGLSKNWTSWEDSDLKRWSKDLVVYADKPTSVELENTDGQKPEEVKSQDKTFNQDGENKTLVTGEEKKEMSDAEAATIMGGASATDMDAADIGVSSHEVADPYKKKPVCEMTIEQEVNDPWKLSEMLWGQGKENLKELLDSNLFSDDRIMGTLEQFDVRDLTNLNDLLAFDFESVLDALGCDVEVWTKNLEITRA